MRSPLFQAGATSTALVVTALLVGCSRPMPNPETHNRPVPQAIKDSDSLPSMSTYTRTRGEELAQRSAPKAISSGLSLAPGQYCFYEETANNWLSIRLKLDDDQQLSGESRGTVTHPTQGEMLYQQVLSGWLAESQAKLEVTTYIADITNHRQEQWHMDTTQLDMGRVSLQAVPCSTVSARFST